LSEIPEFIHAMSRLNSWLRSPDAKGLHHTPARAIYFLKREAIEWADQNLHCLHSTVIVGGVSCRACGGTGKYTDSYGTEFPHCRACSSRGSLSLLFVQTAIGGGPVWHTPYLKFYIRHRTANVCWLLKRWAEGWTVNEPGHSMKPWEVARDLNLLETTLTRRPGWYSTDWGTFNDFNYSLYLGATPADVCSFCGEKAPPNYGNFLAYAVTRKGISWTDHACTNCELHWGRSSAAIFSKFPIPVVLVDNLHIVSFIERHEYEMDILKNSKQKWD